MSEETKEIIENVENKDNKINSNEFLFEEDFFDGEKKEKIKNPDKNFQFSLEEEKRELIKQSKEKNRPEQGIISEEIHLPITKTVQVQAIEDVLSKGLDDVYLSMDKQKRSDFKNMGEETAQKIDLLLSETKVKVNKIIDLIKKWLSLIPGVNRFFLEQEAKIRADEIIKIKKINENEK